MKKQNKIITTILFLSLLVMTPILIGSHNKAIESNSTNETSTIESERTIIVSGKGKINSIPDTGYITVGVTNKNKDLELAQSKVSENINKIILNLKEIGIEKENIQTSTYNINPVYNWDKEDNVNNIEGYQVTSMLNIKVLDISKIGKVIEISTNNGSNSINGIRFDISNKEESYLKALELAVENAKEKALLISESQNLGNIEFMTITETSSENNYFPRYSSYDSVIESSSVPIEEGEIETSAQVNIIFKFK